MSCVLLDGEKATAVSTVGQDKPEITILPVELLHPTLKRTEPRWSNAARRSSSVVTRKDGSRINYRIPLCGSSRSLKMPFSVYLVVRGNLNSATCLPNLLSKPSHRWTVRSYKESPSYSLGD